MENEQVSYYYISGIMKYLPADKRDRKKIIILNCQEEKYKEKITWF